MPTIPAPPRVVLLSCPPLTSFPTPRSSDLVQATIKDSFLRLAFLPHPPPPTPHSHTHTHAHSHTQSQKLSLQAPGGMTEQSLAVCDSLGSEGRYSAGGIHLCVCICVYICVCACVCVFVSVFCKEDNCWLEHVNMFSAGRLSSEM